MKEKIILKWTVNILEESGIKEASLKIKNWWFSIKEVDWLVNWEDFFLNLEVDLDKKLSIEFEWWVIEKDLEDWVFVYTQEIFIASNPKSFIEESWLLDKWLVLNEIWFDPYEELYDKKVSIAIEWIKEWKSEKEIVRKIKEEVEKKNYTSEIQEEKKEMNDTEIDESNTSLLFLWFILIMVIIWISVYSFLKRKKDKDD